MAYTNPAAYERFMGRWSARLAPLFAAFADIRGGGRVLDVGCGTGILCRILLDLDRHIEVVGIDPAASYIDYVCRSAWSRRARFQVGTAEMLPFVDAAFDNALALLILQELPDAPRALREMARVTRRGGCVAACKWDLARVCQCSRCSGMLPKRCRSRLWLAIVPPRAPARTTPDQRSLQRCGEPAA